MRPLQRVLVIGGGIHGVASALVLARRGLDVTVLEKRSDILRGVSAATHNRAHAGYHYPRSAETALECQDGLRYFKEYYPECLVYPAEMYYAISKEDSRTSADAFYEFCQSMELPCISKWPSECFLQHEALEDCFLCTEPLYDVHKLRGRLWHQLTGFGVCVKTNTLAVDVEPSGPGGVHSTEALFRYEYEKIYKSEIIVNATYADTNLVLGMFGERLVDYRFQNTEVIAVTGRRDIPALTIMDGPFCSLLPEASGWKSYLAYDVLYSAHEDHPALFPWPASRVSKWPEMQESMSRFFPFASGLSKVRSLWGSRPIPIAAEGNSRQTRVVSHGRGLYSILEGKFISAFTTAEKLWRVIKEECLL